MTLGCAPTPGCWSPCARHGSSSLAGWTWWWWWWWNGPPGQCMVCQPIHSTDQLSPSVGLVWLQPVVSWQCSLCYTFIWMAKPALYTVLSGWSAATFTTVSLLTRYYFQRPAEFPWYHILLLQVKRYSGQSCWWTVSNQIHSHSRMRISTGKVTNFPKKAFLVQLKWISTAPYSDFDSLPKYIQHSLFF